MSSELLNNYYNSLLSYLSEKNITCTKEEDFIAFNVISPEKINLVSKVSFFRELDSIFFDVVFYPNKEISELELLHLINVYNKQTIGVNIFLSKDNLGIYSINIRQDFTLDFSLEKKESVQMSWLGILMEQITIASCFSYFLVKKYISSEWCSIFSVELSYDIKFQSYLESYIIDYYDKTNKRREKLIKKNQSKNNNKIIDTDSLVDIQVLEIYEKQIAKLNKCQLEKEMDEELIIFKKTKNKEKLNILYKYLYKMK